MRSARPAATGWRGLELPIDERLTLDGCLRQVDFLDAEVAAIDREIARQALKWPQVLRLMTVPGVNVQTAATFMAAIGDIRRFPLGASVGQLSRP